MKGSDSLLQSLVVRRKRKNFVADQQPLPDMSSWHIDASSSVKQWVKDALNNVSQGFSAQLRQAELRAEYDALLKRLHIMRS